MMPGMMMQAGLIGRSGGLKVQDVFAASLYTGNGGSQSISNGLNIAGRGGLVWLKDRSLTGEHYLYDTVRGVSAGGLSSNLTNSQQGSTKGLTAFNSDGFSITNDTNVLSNLGDNYGSLSFCKASKFLDIVTYTGTGAVQVLNHSLGVTPGMILVKRVDGTSSWYVYHRAIGAGALLNLNNTNGQATSGTVWNNNGGSSPDATTFTIGTNVNVNTSGAVYIAILFAHDPDTTNGIIQCGSFAIDSSNHASVTLGWEPQFVLAKLYDTTGNWFMFDTARGMVGGGSSDQYLYANSSASESGGANYIDPTSTGFTINTGFGADDNAIFMAIRKGPM